MNVHRKTRQIMWRNTKWHARGKARQEVLSKQLGEYFIWRGSDILSDRGQKEAFIWPEKLFCGEFSPAIFTFARFIRAE